MTEEDRSRWSLFWGAVAASLLVVWTAGMTALLKFLNP